MEGLKTSILVILAVTVACFGSSPLSLPVEKQGTLGSEEIGPINYTCPDDGVFPTDNCTDYVSCWEGTAILNRCTDVMLFDLQYDGCNYAEYVHCQDRYRPPDYPGTVSPSPTTTTVDPSASTVPTTPPPNGTFVCPNDGVFPHAQRCEYYWSCYNGEAVLVHCELDYLYDLRYLGCNFPQYVDCGDRERPIGSPSTVTPPESTSPPTPSTAAPTGTTASTPTPTGTTDPGNNSTSTSGPGFQCPNPDGSFADPEDCTKYFVCDAGIPIHADCPDGLYFNPITSMCDWKDNVDCQIGL